MRIFTKGFIVLAVGLMIFGPTLASANPSARIIPTGNVSLLADGKEVNQFRSEMPLPEGMMMVKSGTCMVQTESLQLTARDQAVFGLAESGGHWDLIVNSGRIEYALRSGAKPVTIHTPHDNIQTERGASADGSDGVVRGFVTVSDKGTELTVLEGALQVASRDGSQLVQAGNAIVWDQTGSSKMVAAAGAATVAAGAGASSLSTGGAAAGIAAVAGVAAAVGLGSGGDPVKTSNKDLSPF